MMNTTNEQITEVLVNRQKYIVSKLPSFFKATSIIAFLAFAVTVLLQLRHNSIMTAGFDGVVEQISSHITVPGMVAWALGIFSNLIIWLFVIWSIVFVPFIILQSLKASKGTPSSVRTKPLRWVPLFAAAFFPVAVFAIAWESVGPKQTVGVSLKVTNLYDTLWLCCGTVSVIAVIWLTNTFIPKRHAAVRLSFFSLLLYLSIFLTYGFEISMASHSMVFGILIYLMFGSNEFAELARRISLYDMDPQLAEHIDSILNRYQEVDNLRSEIHLKRQEHEVQEETHKLAIQIEKDKSEQNLAEQLANIHKRGLELSEQLNQTQLKFIDDKIQALSEVYSIVSHEAQARVKDDIPKRLAELRERVKSMSPEELRVEMDGLSQKISASLGGIPESLGPIRQQLLIATRQLKEQTKAIADERAYLAEEVHGNTSEGFKYATGAEQDSATFRSGSGSPRKEQLRPPLPSTEE